MDTLYNIIDRVVIDKGVIDKRVTDTKRVGNMLWVVDTMETVVIQVKVGDEIYSVDVQQKVCNEKHGLKLVVKK